jgi:putative serine protease PepD
MTDPTGPDEPSPAAPDSVAPDSVAPDSVAPVLPEPLPAAPGTVTVVRRGPGLLGTVGVAAVVALIVGAFAGLAGYAVGQSVDRTTTTTSAAAPATTHRPVGMVAPAADIADIAKATLPSVVSILAEGADQAGSGSGFVIRPNGYILTNNHVVDLAAGGGDLTVVFSDGSRAPGTVVGTSPSYDLAVVKVDRTDLPVVTMGDSGDVQVGDVAIAIGAPLGLDGTVTSGIVSALDRPVRAGDSGDVSYINAIQTDAAINPGNSGGPLLDASGQVIGINSAIASLASGAGSEVGNIGLGFAIPTNSARRIADELIASGTSRTPVMGVQLDMAFGGPGARVESITSDSGAQDAGLRAGDVITSVDDRAIDDATELVVAVRSYSPGDTIEVGFQREGRSRTVELVLGDDSGGR